MSGHTLETKLSRFLFQYRITPYTTTGISPAEMLMGGKPKSHLDLLHPDVGVRVVRSLEEQKERRDRHAKERFFKPGDCVFIKNFSQGPPQLPGIICHQTGPVSFMVDLCDGRQIRRHQDHLRVRHRAGGERPQSVAHKDSVDSSTADWEVPVAPQHNDGLSVPTDGLFVTQPVGSPSPAQSTQPVCPPVGLRRSKRQHKPPDRLTC